MIGIKNSFRGGLDLDTDFFNLKPNSYVDALNITLDAVERNRDFAATNIVGNRKVSYTLPSGVCKVIGAKEDLIRDRVIYFVWNANGYHSILKYTNSTRTISKILENLTDTGNEDILGFSQYKKIIHIEVVHREEGDLLYWTDGYTQPKGFIIDKIEAGTYGTVISAYIEAAKRPPLVPATVAYGDDSTHNTNSLRRQLYQFQYRWVFDDDSKSTWSMWSDVPLPLGADDPSVGIDPTQNNVIQVGVTSGLANVTDIEISVRQSLGVTWGDSFLAISLNKSELSIPDESDYQYSFYNDGIYPPLDPRESILLFDYVPLLAKSMVLANGNVLVYGAITEGYDKLEEVDIELTTTNLKNTPLSVGGATLTYTRTGGLGVVTYTITVGGTVATGTRYRVFALIYDGATYTQITLSDYTATSGQTTAQVAQALHASTPPQYQDGFGSSSYFVVMPTGSFIITTQIDYNSSGTEISTQSSWLWDSRYSFGLVYFDEHGKTNGVVYRVTQCDIVTGSFQLDGGVPKTPVIDAAINHTPPDWAVKYTWARTKNLTFDKVFFYVTNDYQSDTDHYYFGLENVKYFYGQNNNCIYSDISSIVKPGDRIKIMAQANNTGYTGTVWADEDYEILGVVDRVMTGTSTNGKYVKVSSAGSSPTPSYSTNMLAFIYSPAKNATDQASEVFWEFGNTYDIYEDSGNRFHRGMTQDQTISQAAEFRFTEGDIYYRTRSCYYDLIPPNKFFDGYYIMDSNFSDFFISAVNDNGRPEVIDVNAKQTYYPATVRFGQEFQPNTNVNGLPRFYGENFKDYNRVYGGILKMRIRDQYLKVGQQLKVGVVPINLQIIKNIDQSGQLVTSDELLNTINYYDGEFGVGDLPEAWASFNYADYFIDNRRGAILRLSMDGITQLSTLYKVNSWSSDELPLRDGATTFAYGTFDQKLNNYILALEATETSEAQTISFNEEENVFDSFLSFHPDMMVTLGNLLITFKDGELWTHDSESYNTFYGTSYESNLTAVFSEPGLEKKTWHSINEVSDGIWDCPTIYSNVNTYAGQRQETNLVEADFKIFEGNPSAAIKRDINSRGGKVSGQYMKGNWLAVKFRKQTATDLVYLNLVSCKFVDSPLTVT